LPPSLGVGFPAQIYEMAVQRVPQYLGPVNAKRIGPSLNGIRVFIGHTKAKHRHTPNHIAYDARARPLRRTTQSASEQIFQAERGGM
jgi:hypothetical protein